MDLPRGLGIEGRADLVLATVRGRVRVRVRGKVRGRAGVGGPIWSMLSSSASDGSGRSGTWLGPGLGLG